MFSSLQVYARHREFLDACVGHDFEVVRLAGSGLKLSLVAVSVSLIPSLPICLSPSLSVSLCLSLLKKQFMQNSLYHGSVLLPNGCLWYIYLSEHLFSKAITKSDSQTWCFVTQMQGKKDYVK